MKKYKRERLKDILIDHVFDFCFHEIVHKIESKNIKLAYDNPEHEYDPEIRSFIQDALKTGYVKSYFSPRETEYFTILIDEDIVYKGLTDKLLNLGFIKGPKLFGEIENAQN